jgi:hypothetical protein
MVLFVASWIKGKNIPACPYRCDSPRVPSTRVSTGEPDKKQKQKDKQDDGTDYDTNEGFFR